MEIEEEVDLSDDDEELLLEQDVSILIQNGLLRFCDLLRIQISQDDQTTGLKPLLRDMISSQVKAGRKKREIIKDNLENITQVVGSSHLFGYAKGLSSYFSG